MTKYELSLTRDYVPGWNVTHAIRELFQNALDQQIVAEDNPMFWEYYPKEQTLHIGNKLSVLEPKTLLLGSTTKMEDDRTIGKYGEGYKIALLVLTRLNKKVTVFNYGAREVWRVRFSKSRKYNSEILVVETDKQFPWKAIPNNNLTITIENISEEDFKDIKESNLHMQDSYTAWKNEKGKILLDEHHHGKLFVNGLYVSSHKDLKYGYDFLPESISLDRDRTLVQDFDLLWATSSIWNSFKDESYESYYAAIEEGASLVGEGAIDVKYLNNTSYYSSSNTYTRMATTAYSNFREKHGSNAIPVATQEELEAVSSSKAHKAVLVSESTVNVIKASPDYNVDQPVKPQTLRAALMLWKAEYGIYISEEAFNELLTIVEEYR